MSILRSFVGTLLLNISNLLSFVDRDMLMRYHWGLAVGHVYTHGSQTTPNAPRSQSQPQDEEIANIGAGGASELEPEIQIEEDIVDNVSEGGDEEDAQFGLESREAEDLLDTSEEETDTEDDERLLAMEEMYNS